MHVIAQSNTPTFTLCPCLFGVTASVLPHKGTRAVNHSARKPTARAPTQVQVQTQIQAIAETTQRPGTVTNTGMLIEDVSGNAGVSITI
jgi:hypothetical protein